MFNLINSNDSLVMTNINISKNAVFYKDMLAFYDAFDHILKAKKEELPKYCFNGGELYLDGLCLLIKMYSSEFGFHSLSLNLDYLKTLYYAIAGYSKNQKTVQKVSIQKDFDAYKKMCLIYKEKTQENLNIAKKNYRKQKNDYEEQSNLYAQKLIISNIFNILKFMFLIVGTFCAMLPFTFYYLEKLVKTDAIIYSTSIFLFFVCICMFFHYSSKKLQNNAKDIAYELQYKIKQKNSFALGFGIAQSTYNQINSEAYEAYSLFNVHLLENGNPLNISDILSRARKYNFKSFNPHESILNLFKQGQKEIDSLVKKINTITLDKKYEKLLKLTYDKLLENDWLYFNNQIRFSFLLKLIDLYSSGNYEVKSKIKNWNYCFDYDLLSLYNENIAYLKSKEDLFTKIKCFDCLNQKNFKGLDRLSIKSENYQALFGEIKSNYADKFYDYNSLKLFDNLFSHSKLSSEKVSVGDVILNTQKMIPILLEMKLLLVEAGLKISNADTDIIKTIEKKVLSEVDSKVSFITKITPEDVTYPSFECDDIVAVGTKKVKYTTGKKIIVGIKTNKL